MNCVRSNHSSRPITVFGFIALLLTSWLATPVMAGDGEIMFIDGFEGTGNVPQFVSIDDQAIPAQQLLQIDADTSEPANQAGLKFSLLVSPSGMTINSASGLISWTPTLAQVGTESVTVQVEDLAQLANTLAFNIDVINPSASPLITAIADATLLVDELFTLQVEANDPDPGDVLDYSLDTAPAGLSIDQFTGLLEWMPDASAIGSHPVTVRATDSSGQFDTESFDLSVVAANQPPELMDIADRGAAPGVAMELIADAIDSDGNPLTWSLLERPPGMTIEADSGTLRWVPVLQQLGPHRVVVQVVDSPGFADTTSFEVFVDANRAPVAVDDTGFAVERGDTLNVSAPGVLNNDFDPNDDPLVTQLVDGPARGALALNADGSFDYTPDNPAGTIGFVEKWSFLDPPIGRNDWSPIIANLDDDPQSEILMHRVSGATTVIRALDGISGEIEWELVLGFSVTAPEPRPAIADLNGDGRGELLVIHGERMNGGFNKFRLIAISHDGHILWISEDLPRWFYMDGNRRTSRSLSTAAIAVADLDQDGIPEVIAAPADGPAGFHVWDHEGRTLASVFEPDTNPGDPSLAAARTRITLVDLDLDGDLEIVVGDTAWHHDGSLIWKLGLKSGPDPNFPIVVNLDDDPYPELVRTRGLRGPGNPGDILAINHDGTILWEASRPGVSGNSLANSAPMTAADVNGDGYADVLRTNPPDTDLFEVLDGRDGSTLWSKNVPTRFSGATAIDLDRDGFLEVVLFSEDLNLYVWDGRDGTDKGVFDVPGAIVRPGANSVPVFADVDADGQAELVLSVDGSIGTTPAVIVLESPNDDWPPMRSIWNQMRYHVTNINDDLSVPAIQQPHWLLPGLNRYMVNERLPEARIEDSDRFSYRASDGELVSNTASVEITILPPNSPPRILSTPKTLASPGFEYVYNALAVDADAGEVLTWSLAEAPAAMTVDSLGRVRWTPQSADLGEHSVVIEVRDSIDLSAFQNFIIEVRDPVTVPNLAGLDEAEAIGALEAATLRADPLRDTFSDTVPTGRVAAQNPAPGTPAAAGGSVEVEISRGPVPVVVPRLTGLKLDDALAALFDAGLSASPVDWVNDPNLPHGVIRQQDPSPNARVAPGSDIALVVSGGPRAVIQVDPPLIPAGGSAVVTVEIRETDGALVNPQPAVTLSLDVDPDALFGSVPTLNAATVQTGIDSQGAFTIEASFDTGSPETITASAAVLPAISDGPGGTIYTEFTRQLVDFQLLVAALIEAVDLGDGPTIEVLDQALADLEAAIDVGRLRTMTAIAPEGGVPPTPAQAISGGLVSDIDDNAYAEIGLDLVVLLETLDEVVREGTAPDLVINQLNQDMAAAASALAQLEPSAVGVLRATPEITALLGTYAPRMLLADIQAVRQALRDAGAINANGRALPGRFTLPGIMTASSIRQSIISDFYVPYLGQVARAMGTIIAADLLQPYANGGAIVGVITGGSIAIHVFDIPNSVVEGFGYSPKISPNNAVTMVGPSLISAVQDALGGLPSAGDFKDLNSIYDAIQGQIASANAVDKAWKDANSIPRGGVARGCILDGTPGCRQLIYPDGFASVYQATGLSLPAPVITIVRNLESGGMAVFVANFVPTPEED